MINENLYLLEKALNDLEEIGYRFIMNESDRLEKMTKILEIYNNLPKFDSTLLPLVQKEIIEKYEFVRNVNI